MKLFNLPINFEFTENDLRGANGVACVSFQFISDGGGGWIPDPGGGAGNVTPADDFPNPTNAAVTYSLLGGWDENDDGWWRIRSQGYNLDGDSPFNAAGLRVASYPYVYDALLDVVNRTSGYANNVDNVAVSAVGNNAGTVAFNYVFDGATWDRTPGNSAGGLFVQGPGAAAAAIVGSPVRIGLSDGANTQNVLGLPDNADGVVVSAVANGVKTQARNSFFNGTSWDRARNNSAANISAAVQSFAVMVASPGEWSQAHVPGANVAATTTRAAIAGVRHVCRSISASFGNLSAGASLQQLVLRDGLTGAGAILWSINLAAPGLAAGSSSLTPFGLSGLNIVGTAGNAMTLEFINAGGALVYETVALTGYDAQ